MKRLFMLAFILMLALSGACSQSTTAAPTADSTPDSTEIPEPDAHVTFSPWTDYEHVLPQTCISWAYYDTLADLCEHAQHIVVGTVRNIDVVPKPNDANDVEGFREAVFTYTFGIDQTLSGDLAVSDNASVWQMGWQYGDINVYHPDSPPLEYDKTYIMFLRENADIDDSIYPAYHFLVPFEAHPEITDSVIHPHPRSRFFENDMSADDAIAMVADEVARQNAPGQITAQRGTQNLITLAAFAPDQTPVRDLSRDEMQSVCALSGDSRVLDMAGKELENGDLFIWIKTQKLTNRQQDALYDALNTAVEKAADGTHYKVTCRPFHSMVSICNYNEDNATIHDAFLKVIDGQIDIEE